MTPTTPENDPTQSVSYSSMTLHRKCPQAFAYRHIRNLVSTSRASARDLGSWWHLVRAMDSLKRGEEAGTLLGIPRNLSTGDERVRLSKAAGTPLTYRLPDGRTLPVGADPALALVSAYWRGLDSESKDGWIEDIGEPLPDRLTYLEARWQERWAEDIPNEVPLGVEVKWRRDLPGTQGATIPGYVDEIYLDTKRNLIVVRDHKTHKSLPQQEAADDLSDSQLHLYAWGVQEIVAEWAEKLDLPTSRVGAIGYDRVRTAKPKQPALTLAGALSKSVSDYDLATYLAFAAGPDGDGVPWGEPDTFIKSGKRAGERKWGKYQADPKVIEALSTPTARDVWHRRTLTPLNRNVIMAHLTAAADTQQQAVRTLAQFEEHGAAPRNFTRQGCQWCDYAKLCRAELLGGSGGVYPLEQFNLVKRLQ